MKSNLRLSIVFFCIFLLPSQALAEENLSTLVNKIQPAIVTVITYNKDKEVSGLGTGFFIDKKGHLITNFHVLEGAYFAEVKLHDKKKYPIKFVVAENEDVDLIKVLIDIPKKNNPRPVKLSPNLPEIAESVFVIGSPLGLEKSISQGITSAIRKLPNMGEIIQITAPISPGSSGSPVVNLNGEVVGVATLYFAKGQNLNFAVTVENILKLKHEQFQKSITDWTLNRLRMADKLYEQGRVLYLSDFNRRDEALNIFERVLKLNPNHIEVYLQMSIIFESKKKYDHAIASLNKVLEISPDPRAYTMRGRQWFFKGNYDEAITDFTRVLETNPYHSETYMFRGYCHVRKAEDIEKDITAEITNVEKANRFLFAIDRWEVELGKALADFRKAYKLDPKNKELEKNLLFIEKKNKKVKELQASAKNVEVGVD